MTRARALRARSMLARARRHDDGAYSVDWAHYPDGATLPPGVIDAHEVIPARNDPLEIESGKLAIATLQGPDDQNFDYSGWRGAAYRDTRTLSNNVSGGGISSGAAAAGAALHFNFAGDWFAISTWYNPIGFLELGAIGRNQQDFSYLDATFMASPDFSGKDVRIRSVDNEVAVEVDGVALVGPVAIPTDLQGSTIHGIQIEASDEAHEGVGRVPAFSITEDATALGGRTGAPTVRSVGTAADTAAATSIDVAHPATISADDLLVACIASKGTGEISATGWTHVGHYGAGPRVHVLRKTATGSETGDETFDNAASEVMAGVMLAVADPNTHVPVLVSGQANASDTDVPSPARQLIGILRLGLWIAALDTDADVTLPSGWTSRSTGVSGSQALRLVVGSADLDGHASNPGPPYNAYTTDHFPIQTGTAASAAASAAGVILVNPDI